MIKSRNDYRCRLIGKNGVELLKFNASTVDNLINNVTFIGGGIASAGQALTIWTERAFEYKAHEHSVVIDGTKYIITSISKGMRKKFGANCMTKIVPVYVLSLE